MLILLPPSEGKRRPGHGSAVDLETLSFPELTAARTTLLDTVVRLCAEQPATAATALGLGPRQAADVTHNVAVLEAPAAPAREVYTGVLYDALGLGELTGEAARRADTSLVVTSGLWGLLRPVDVIPAYRLGGGVNLPGVGGLAAYWRPALRASVPRAAGDGFVVDLRSSTYASFWRPDDDLARRTACVRVLREQDGRRSVVSHHNKAAKGRIARELLHAPGELHTAQDLADHLSAGGWTVELTPPARRGAVTVLDVVS